MINKNKLASCVARLEGLKKQIDIAQIKEVQRYTLDELAKLDLHDVIGELSKRRSVLKAKKTKFLKKAIKNRDKNLKEA